MKQLLFTIAKAGAMFFAFGALLAFCAPYIGATIGLAPTAAAASSELGRMGNPLLAGGAFAAIGILDPLCKPIFRRIFKSPPEAEKALK